MQFVVFPVAYACAFYLVANVVGFSFFAAVISGVLVAEGVFVLLKLLVY